jgi:G3E family GTPase
MKIDLAFADRIVLNKIDLVSEAEASELERRISSINALAPVIRTSQCNVPLESIVGLHAFSTTRSMSLMDEKASNLQHSSDVRTVSWVEDRPVSLERFRRWLGSVLWESEQRSEELFRAKAVVNAIDDDHRYVMQAVHELFDISPNSLWPAGERRATRIVFIGRK